jgi:transcriptional regulator with XRE-family HTH domain
MEFSDMLQKFREGKGMTQAELAKRAGVSIRTIQSWEQGHRAPVSPDFFRVIKALGVSADDFASASIGKRSTKRKGR